MSIVADYESNKPNFDVPFGTTITLSNCYGAYTVTIKKDDMVLGEIFADLVKPVLLAAGYQTESISDYLNDE